MARGKRTVRASEIGSFMYCQRAWWYQRQGIQPMNQEALDTGSEFHSIHAGQSRTAFLIRLAAWIIFFTALVFLAFTLFSRLSG